MTLVAGSNTMDVEIIRERYRPGRITTLFVGESAPHSGAFFYCAPNAMLQHMQTAVESALGESGGDFLERFKAYGWYLDDLVLTPVDKLFPPPERKAACKGARFAIYRPEAIVAVLKSVESDVRAAAIAADSNAALHAVPLPRHGQPNALPGRLGAHHPRTSKVDQ